MVFVRLALGVIWYLVVEHWPKDHFAKVQVVAVKVVIRDKYSQRFVVGGQLFSYSLLLLVMQCISRHPQCTNP